MPSVP